MQIDWPTVTASGLASFVEFVEALTIVLAVGVVRGWREAIAGTTAAGVALALLVLIVGPHIAGLDLPLFKVIVGTLLTLFGLRWLRKAILRTAGVIAFHDEAKSFARKSAALEGHEREVGFDFGAAATAFNGVFIEGIEVVFIVLAVGGSGGRSRLLQASLGAAAAAAAVVVLGFAARRPLTRIPENALKFAVGVLVSAFGTFWTGEGLHIDWPGGGYALSLVAAAYTALAFVAVVIARLAANRPIGTANQ